MSTTQSPRRGRADVRRTHRIERIPSRAAQGVHIGMASLRELPIRPDHDGLAIMVDRKRREAAARTPGCRAGPVSRDGACPREKSPDRSGKTDGEPANAGPDRN